MGDCPKAGGWASLLLYTIAGCHSGSLVGVSGSLIFSSPDQPSAVQRIDAGMVQIAFGQVAIDSTKTMTLSVQTITTAAVTLGSLTQLLPDAEFSLPFMPGTVVEPSPPSQITVGFSPTSPGNKIATYSLPYAPPAGQTVTIELTGDGVPSGLSVAPNPVDFGNVELNQQQPVSLTITNATDSPANLTLSGLGGSNPNEFSLGALSDTALDPGASASLNAIFGPLVTGPASATFTITGAVIAGAPTPPTTVSLSGTGIQSWLQVTSPLDFGYVPPGETLVKSVVLKNAGSFTTLHLVVPAPRIAQLSGGSAFALSSPQPALPLAIAPGLTAQIPVSFAPPSQNSYRGTLSLATDDPGSLAPVIQLEGNGGGPQILCTSPLDFGPVPLGYSGSLRTICVNAGADIPGDPDGGLRIAQANLSTDNQAFVASLTLPDGGLAGPEFSVSLAAGQSAAIEVTFRPVDAGIYRDRLLVPSSDLGDADAGVTLAGEGLVPGLCSVEVFPSQLSFGEVASGDTGVLQFEIDNTGQNLCALTGIGIDPQSDPAFSLPGGNLGYRLLSFPGDADNPAALPTTLTVDVQFAPTTAESVATGTVDVTISNARPSNQTVSLVGQSTPACLTLEPSLRDFGLVGFSPSDQQICIPDTACLSLKNTCSAAVTITGIVLNSGVAAAPQFLLAALPQLPLTVAPDGQVGFQASFVPTNIGANLGAISVGTSEFPEAPFLITLRGDAETAGARTDTFIASASRKPVDVLWLLDEDDDLNQVNFVASMLPQLVDVMDEEGIDYQMAVTSNDTCDGGSSDQGSLEPCDHCLSKTSAAPLLVTPQTPGPAMALSDLFAFFDLEPQNGFCEGIVGDEHFLDAIADAFSPALLAGHNSGFIRDGASLAVVLVNEDPEDDGYDATAGNSGLPRGPYLTSVAEATSLVQGLKPDPCMASVSLIYGSEVTPIPKMAGLVMATGGVLIKSTTAMATEAELTNLLTIGVGAFHLSSTPVAPGQIQVFVDGLPPSWTSWTYDSLANDVVFQPADIPASGSTVTVTYDVGCP